MTLISVVIPTYNRRQDLKRCLDSIEASFEDYELIVVDDASTDGSFEALQQWQYKHLRAFRNSENRGVNYTRNRGIEQARGTYIAFLDSDDAFRKGALDTIRKAILEEHRPHYLFYVDSYTPHAAADPFETTYEDWITEKVFGDFTHVISREVLLQYPFFEQFRAYEALNWLRIIRATSPQKVIPTIITWVDLQRSDNLTKTLKLKNTAAIRGKFEFLIQYFKLYGADLLRLAPALFYSKFRHAVLLGIAADRKEEVGSLLRQYPQVPGYYHWWTRLLPVTMVNQFIRLKANF